MNSGGPTSAPDSSAGPERGSCPLPAKEPQASPTPSAPPPTAHPDERQRAGVQTAQGKSFFPEGHQDCIGGGARGGVLQVLNLGPGEAADTC